MPDGSRLAKHEAYRRWGDWVRHSFGAPERVARAVGYVGAWINVLIVSEAVHTNHSVGVETTADPRSPQQGIEPQGPNAGQLAAVGIDPRILDSPVLREGRRR